MTEQVEGCSHDYVCTKCGITQFEAFMRLLSNEVARKELDKMAKRNNWSKEELEARLNKLKTEILPK